MDRVMVHQMKFLPFTHFGLHLLAFTLQIMWWRGQQGELILWCAKLSYLPTCSTFDVLNCSKYMFFSDLKFQWKLLSFYSWHWKFSSVSCMFFHFSKHYFFFYSAIQTYFSEQKNTS